MNNSATFRVFKVVHPESLLSKLPGHHHHLRPSSGQRLQRMHGQTGALSRGPRGHSTAPGSLGPSRDTCTPWTPAWSQPPRLGAQLGGWVLGSKWGEVMGFWKLTLPLATLSGLMTTRTWIPMGHVGEGERTGPQPPEWLLPLAIGGPWVHSANVLSLKPPQTEQWRGRLFPGHGGRGDTWGHSRHSGVQSRRESGQSPLPHSQFPSPGQPAPVDGHAPPLLWCPRPCTHRPGGPHPDHGHGLPCVQRSEKRRLRRGLKLPPQRQEPGRGFAWMETLPPTPVRTHAGAQMEPPDPRQRRYNKCTPVTTTAGCVA